MLLLRLCAVVYATVVARHLTRAVAKPPLHAPLATYMAVACSGLVPLPGSVGVTLPRTPALHPNAPCSIAPRLHIYTPRLRIYTPLLRIYNPLLQRVYTARLQRIGPQLECSCRPFQRRV